MLRNITEEELKHQIEYTLFKIRETSKYSDKLSEINYDTEDPDYYNIVDKEEEANMASYGYWESFKESNWGNALKIRFLIGSCYTFNHDVSADSVLNVIKEIM